MKSSPLNLPIVAPLILLLTFAAGAQQPLRITHPNGDESLTAGSTTTIRWEGIAPDDTVALSYSTDGGSLGAPSSSILPRMM